MVYPLERLRYHVTGAIERGEAEPISGQNAAMPNHPNRSKAHPSLAANPAPDTIRAAREAAGLSQTDAAALIHCGLRAWQEWEAGARRMHPAFWELWQLKAARL